MQLKRCNASCIPRLRRTLAAICRAAVALLELSPQRRLCYHWYVHLRRTLPDLSGVMLVLLQGVGFKYQGHTIIVELAHNDTIEGVHPMLCCIQP